MFFLPTLEFLLSLVVPDNNLRSLGTDCVITTLCSMGFPKDIITDFKKETLKGVIISETSFFREILCKTLKKMLNDNNYIFLEKDLSCMFMHHWEYSSEFPIYEIPIGNKKVSYQNIINNEEFNTYLSYLVKKDKLDKRYIKHINKFLSTNINENYLDNNEHKHLKHTSMIGTVNNGTLNPWKNFYGQDFPTYYRYKLYLCMVLYNIIINIPRGYIGFVSHNSDDYDGHALCISKDELNKIRLIDFQSQHIITGIENILIYFFITKTDDIRFLYSNIHYVRKPFDKKYYGENEVPVNDVFKEELSKICIISKFNDKKILLAPDIPLTFCCKDVETNKKDKQEKNIDEEFFFFEKNVKPKKTTSCENIRKRKRKDFVKKKINFTFERISLKSFYKNI